VSKTGSVIRLPNPFYDALGFQLCFDRVREGRVPRKTKKHLKKLAWELPAEEVVWVLAQSPEMFDEFVNAFVQDREKL